MNTYLVVSESLFTVVWEDFMANVGHREDYCIAELVVAEKPSQAQWIAWKHDRDSFTGDVRDKPRMATRIAEKNVEGPARILNDPHSELWETPMGKGANDAY